MLAEFFSAVVSVTKLGIDSLSEAGQLSATYLSRWFQVI